MTIFEIRHKDDFVIYEQDSAKDITITSIGKCLEKAVRNNIDLRDAIFTGMNLSNLNLLGGQLGGCDFTNAILTNTILGKASLPGCIFINATCVNTDFSFSNVSNSSFWKANCTKSNFTSANLNCADLRVLTSSGAIWTNAQMKNARK